MTISLKSAQTHFSGLVRGRETDMRGYDEKRVALYHELVFGNVMELLSPCFPVLLSLLPEELWEAIIEGFIAKGAAKSPIFHQYPKDMVDYLEKYPLADYPFAAELAYYEWLELALDICDGAYSKAVKMPANPLEHRFSLASSARILNFRFDVQNIGPEYLPTKENPSYLIMYKTDDKVQFLKISELSFGLLKTMLEQDSDANALLEQIIEAAPAWDRKVLTEACDSLLRLLLKERVLLLKAN